MNTIRIQDIIDKMLSVRKNAEVESIQRAYVYSAAMHAGQVRLSGEPYLMHPLTTAYTLAEMRMDEATICAGLLHDTVEDTAATLEDIRLFAKHKSPNLKIKAAGGISSFEDAEAFLQAGAERLGTSKIIKMMKDSAKEQ